jgi:hypothetical protein
MPLAGGVGVRLVDDERVVVQNGLVALEQEARTHRPPGDRIGGANHRLEHCVDPVEVPRVVGIVANVPLLLARRHSCVDEPK